MFDIDHFKKVNDSYGHIAGDYVLKRVANAVKSAIRTEDICGRWGGEEFLLILPRTSVSAASAVAEKLRLVVSTLVTEWEGQMIPVTISLGVGQFLAGIDMDASIEHVDKALYQAKKNGRNCYVIAGDFNDS